MCDDSVATLRDVEISDDVGCSMPPPLSTRQARRMWSSVDNFGVHYSGTDTSFPGIIPYNRCLNDMDAMEWLYKNADDFINHRSNIVTAWPQSLQKELGSPYDVWFRLKTVGIVLKPIYALCIKPYIGDQVEENMNEQAIAVAWKIENDRCTYETLSPNVRDLEDRDMLYIFITHPLKIYRRIRLNVYRGFGEIISANEMDINTYVFYSTGDVLLNKGLKNFYDAISSPKRKPLLFQTLCNIDGPLRPYMRVIEPLINDLIPIPNEVRAISQYTLPSTHATKYLIARRVGSKTASLCDVIDNDFVTNVFAQVIGGDNQQLALAEEYFYTFFKLEEFGYWISLLYDIKRAIHNHNDFNTNVANYLNRLFILAFDAAVAWCNRIRACWVYKLYRQYSLHLPQIDGPLDVNLPDVPTNDTGANPPGGGGGGNTGGGRRGGGGGRRGGGGGGGNRRPENRDARDIPPHNQVYPPQPNMPPPNQTLNPPPSNTNVHVPNTIDTNDIILPNVPTDNPEDMDIGMGNNTSNNPNFNPQFAPYVPPNQNLFPPQAARTGLGDMNSYVPSAPPPSSQDSRPIPINRNSVVPSTYRLSDLPNVPTYDPNQPPPGVNGNNPNYIIPPSLYNPPHSNNSNNNNNHNNHNSNNQFNNTLNKIAATNMITQNSIEGIKRALQELSACINNIPNQTNQPAQAVPQVEIQADINEVNGLLQCMEQLKNTICFTMDTVRSQTNHMLSQTQMTQMHNKLDNEKTLLMNEIRQLRNQITQKAFEQQEILNRMQRTLEDTRQQPMVSFPVHGDYNARRATLNRVTTLLDTLGNNL